MKITALKSITKTLLISALSICTVNASAQDTAATAGASQDTAQATESAQQDPNASPQDGSSPGSSGEQLTIFGQPFPGHLTVSGDVSFDHEYDDNVFAGSLFRFSDNIGRVSGRMSAAVQGKRTVFQVHYVPGYRFYYKYDSRSAFSQQFVTSMTHRLSGHTTLDWSTVFSDSSVNNVPPFTFANLGGTIVPVFYPSAMQTNTKIFTTHTSLGIDHRFSARSSVHAALTGNTVNFSSLNGIGLNPSVGQGSFSVGGDIGWNYEFVHGRKLGAEVGHRYFGFLTPSSHASYQYAKLRFEQRLPLRFNLSIGAGPSFREEGSGVRKGYAMDVSLARSTPNSSMVIDFRNDSRLGQAQGALAAEGVSISLARQFWRRWSSSGGFSYSRNHIASGNGLLESYAPNAQLAYLVTPALRATLGYQYIYQSGLSNPLFPSSFDRSFYTIGLVYNFGSIFRQ